MVGEKKTKVDEGAISTLMQRSTCNEVNTIAFECPCGNMHVADKNVKVEIKVMYYYYQVEERKNAELGR